MQDHSDRLPESCDLRALGLDPADLRRVTLLHQGHGSRLYRVERADRSFVLKWFADPERAVEVRAYTLLAELDVPTLPVHGRADSALLLEDLAASPEWRLAAEADVEHAATGVAVADWYRRLHAAGRMLLADGSAPPSFLAREADALDAPTILEMGRRLGLPAHPVWALAAESVETLKRALRSLPETLNYDDFHWTNLALSRRPEPAPRAIVFDYHLLGVGPRYADYRNVVGSLAGAARAAFREAYGPVDEREAILDAPVSTLYSLRVALARPRLPAWAKGSLDAIASGELERSLRRALEVAE